MQNDELVRATYLVLNKLSRKVLRQDSLRQCMLVSSNLTVLGGEFLERFD